MKNDLNPCAGYELLGRLLVRVGLVAVLMFITAVLWSLPGWIHAAIFVACLLGCFIFIARS